MKEAKIYNEGEDNFTQLSKGDENTYKFEFSRKHYQVNLRPTIRATVVSFKVKYNFWSTNTTMLV